MYWPELYHLLYQFKSAKILAMNSWQWRRERRKTSAALQVSWLKWLNQTPFVPSHLFIVTQREHQPSLPGHWEAIFTLTNNKSKSLRCVKLHHTYNDMSKQIPLVRYQQGASDLLWPQSHEATPAHMCQSSGWAEVWQTFLNVVIGTLQGEHSSGTSPRTAWSHQISDAQQG